MSITDELRAWAHGFTEPYKRNEQQLLAIADRIEAEALSRRNEAYNMGYKAGIDMGFASADDWLADHEDAMAEHGWVKLPVDADGVPIHVGERVQLIGNDPSTVSHMSLADDGWRVYVKYDGGIGTGSGEPKRIRHHKPTVEDVLREMVAAYMDTPLDDSNDGEFYAEYAAKLRLAGDAE